MMIPPHVAAEWALEALDRFGIGVAIVDASGELTYVNASARPLLGEAAGGRSWAQAERFFEPDETTPFAAEALPFDRVLAGEASHDVPVFIRATGYPTGGHWLVSGTPLGDRPGAVFFFRDAAERRARDGLRVTAELQRAAILDNIPDMAWLKDRESRFTAVNQVFLDRYAGRPIASIVGMTDFHFAPPDLAEHYREDDREVVRSARQRRIEERLIDTDGKTRWIDTIKTPVIGPEGDVIGTAGIARDITERKLAEEALRMTNDELERRVTARTRELAEAQNALVRQERLAVLGQLAGGMAHQIRNPLGAIMNAAYVLKRHLNPVMHSDVNDAIRIIHDEVRHADVIITSLLDYARVCLPDRAPFLLSDIINRAITAESIPSLVRVERVVDGDATINVDAEQIHAAIYNLIRNAVEAMPDGGVLRVEAFVRDGEVVIVVSDTGAGLSEYAKAHLFEPLQSTKPNGVGLGLVTARRFVEAHGGRMRAVAVEKGACFEVVLPLL